MPVSDLQEVMHEIESGRASDVIPTLEYLAGLFPTSVTGYVLLARAYEAEHCWPEAMSTWQWALTLMPNSPVVQEGLDRTVRHVARVGTGAAQWTTPADEDFVDLTDQPDMSPHFFREEDEEPVSVGVLVPSSERAAQVPSRDVQIDDLDRLIAELESARITPDPDVNAFPTPDLEDDVDDMVSETLARIYAAQRQFDEAARVYELLAAQHPDRAKEFFALASEMRSRAAEE